MATAVLLIRISNKHLGPRPPPSPESLVYVPLSRLGSFGIDLAASSLVHYSQ